MTTLQRTLPATTTDPELFQQVINVHNHVYVPDLLGETVYHHRVLYDWWNKWNQIYFDNTLTPLFITEGNTDYGKYLGYCMYQPERKILIQQRSIETQESHRFAKHHGNSVRRHEAFESLTDDAYNIALLLLHEMIHQACFEAGVDAAHDSGSWADHCNYIGQDLGMTITFAKFKQVKVPYVDEHGNKKRMSKMKPVHQNLLPGTERMAEYGEQCRFPFQWDSPFIEANTRTLTSGKAVQKNGGEPVILPPQF